MEPVRTIRKAALRHIAAVFALGISMSCAAQWGRFSGRTQGSQFRGIQSSGAPQRIQPNTGSFNRMQGQRYGQAPGNYQQPEGAQRFGGQQNNGYSGQRPRQGGATMGPQQNNVRPGGEHLGQWMQQHRNMTPQQQQRALEREPGFNQLPRQTQERMVERLNRLNSMPEQQRQRVIQRGEALERLSPDQRFQVRSAMGQLGALPEDRRRAVARSFRELRSMSPAQRNQILNSPEYRQQFNDEERGTLGNLLAVSPLLPQSR